MKSTLLAAPICLCCFLIGLGTGWLLFAPPRDSAPPASSADLARLETRLDALAGESETARRAALAEQTADLENALQEKFARAESEIDLLGQDVERNTSLLLRLAAADDARYQHHLQAGIKSRDEGDLDGAIEAFTLAVASRPELFNAYLFRATLFMKKEKWQAALADLETTKRLNPDSPDSWNNIAWIRATCPQEEWRNGALAVEYAQRACELTRWGDAAHLSTLAAAYAEQVDFESARQWQQKCLDIASVEQRGEYERVMELFEQEKPYRDAAASELEDGNGVRSSPQP